MAADGERLTRLEVEVRELRGDVRELTAETLRTRARLHSQESTTQALVMEQRQARRQRADSDRRMERRLQVLTLVVAAVGILEPLIHGGVVK